MAAPGMFRALPKTDAVNLGPVCGICGQLEPTISACERNDRHVVHLWCLQEMVDIAENDIGILKCPNCVQGILFSMAKILSFQSVGIVIPRKGIIAMTQSLQRREMVQRLTPDQKLA